MKLPPDRSSASDAERKGGNIDHRKCPVISIVIPVLNEEQSIARRLYELSSLAGCEVIVVDGGSRDRTREIIRHYTLVKTPVRLLDSPRGRSIQMNAGARVAAGRFLLFLHADTILPLPTYLYFHSLIASDSSLHSGAFAFRVDGTGGWYRWLEKSVGWRNRRMRLPFGDQGIFVRRELFARIGGYREDYPLMEDLDLVRRLKKEDGFRILHDAPVLTSGRRWDSEGRFFTSARNILLQLLFAVGFHPRRLARFYWRSSGAEGGERSG